MIPLNREINIQTPAKVNFFLYIQKKRSDGYHELLMDLVPISFFDTIRFLPSDKDGIQLESNIEGLCPEYNLVIKAVRLLERQTNRQFSLGIQLKKMIPTGAGLGGGSGNAAGVLVTLNQVFELGLTHDQLRYLALKLGADVPFFIDPRPSLASGIGEKLSFLPCFKPLHLLLLFPNFSISTKEAYADCLISARKRNIEEYSTQHLKTMAPDINDFWNSLIKRYPILNTSRQQIESQGAVFTGISGSGSTLFGVFPDETSRNRAYASLVDKGNWQLYHCETMNHYTYL